MNVKINKQKRNTNSLMFYCFYLMDLIEKHQLKGRLVNAKVKDKELISKWKINYNSMVKVLKELKVIKDANNIEANVPNCEQSYKYRIDKSRLLITCLMCIGIGLFDNHRIKKVNKSDFNFLRILNGIDESLKTDEDGLLKKRLFASENEYENKIANYVYDSLQIIVNYEQIFIYNGYERQKTTISKFFENIGTGISHYYELKEINDVLPIPDNSKALLKQLYQSFSNLISSTYLFNYYSYIQPYLQPSQPPISFSYFLSLTSSSPLYQVLYNCVLYIGILVGLLNISLFTHRGEFQK